MNCLIIHFNKFLLICFLFLKNVSNDLKFVFEMFRHGARSPFINMEHNSYDVFGENWYGSGELTSIGIRQHYLLGRSIRERYQNFITTEYDPKEIIIYSTDSNRTIMSAHSHLQGIFPLGTGPTLKNDRLDIAVPPINSKYYEKDKSSLKNYALPDRMQLAPVHIFDKRLNIFDLHSQTTCPGVRQYIEPNLNKKIITDFYSKLNSTWGSQLKLALNYTKENYLFEFDNVQSIMDTFVSDFTDGRELKLLKNAGIDLFLFNQTAYEFLKIDMLEALFGDEDSLVAKISMSPTALELISFMQDRIKLERNGNSLLEYDAPKMVIYSGHDTNLAAVQVFLRSIFNLTDIYYTPYSTSILFELHSKSENGSEYFVNVIYNDINILSLDFEKFKEMIIKNSFDHNTIMSKCGMKDWENLSKIYWWLFLIFIIISFILLVVLLWILFKKGKNANTRYRPVPNEERNSV